MTDVSTTRYGRHVADLLARYVTAYRKRHGEAALTEALERDDYSRNTGPINRSTLHVRLGHFSTAHAELGGLLEAAKALDIQPSTLAICTGTDRDAFWAEFDAWREGDDQ